MSTQEQEQNKTTVWATIFGGILAVAAGPIGIVVAASAVAIQQALFPNVGENDERREERQHEAELDKGARRAKRLATHQARLDAIAAQDRAYRQRYRDYLTNGGDEPYRYALDKNGQPIMVDGKPKRAGFWSRVGQAALVGAAHVVLGAARAHEGYVAEREAAKKRQEAGEPVVKPAVAGLYGAALGYLGLGKSSPASAATDQATPPAPAAPGGTDEAVKPSPDPQASAPLADPERTQEVPRVGQEDRPTEPATSDAAASVDATRGAVSPKPAAGDPKLQQAVDWYATGGSGFPTPTGEGVRQRDERLAYAKKQRELFAEGDGPSGHFNIPTPAEQAEGTENTNGGKQMGETATAQAPAAPTGEANVELVDASVAEAAAAVARIQEGLEQINRDRAVLKAQVAAARARGEVNGAQAPVVASLESFDALADRIGGLVDTAADAATEAEDAGQAARASLEPTKKALDDLRANGGSGDMAATAKSD